MIYRTILLEVTFASKKEARADFCLRHLTFVIYIVIFCGCGSEKKLLHQHNMKVPCCRFNKLML